MPFLVVILRSSISPSVPSSFVRPRFSRLLRPGDRTKIIPCMCRGQRMKSSRARGGTNKRGRKNATIRTWVMGQWRSGSTATVRGYRYNVPPSVGHVLEVTRTCTQQPAQTPIASSCCPVDILPSRHDRLINTNAKSGNAMMCGIINK